MTNKKLTSTEALQKATAYINQVLGEDNPSSIALQPPPKGENAKQRVNTLKDKFWLSDLQVGYTGVHWLWYGYLALGQITLLSAHPKCGKTTILGYLLQAFETQDNFLGLEIKPTKVLILSEESSVLWLERKERLGLNGENISVISRLFPQRPTNYEWHNTIKDIRGICLEKEIKLVVFDTISYHWPVLEENSANDVIEALRPLHLLSEANIAVLLIHHTRKSGSQGDDVISTRGSSALPGFIDITLNLKKDASENRRLLVSSARFEETPSKLVMELTDKGYINIGDTIQVEWKDKINVVLPYIPEKPNGITIKDLCTQLHSHNVLPSVRENTLWRWVKRATETGIIVAVGKSEQSGKPTLWAKTGKQLEDVKISTPADDGNDQINLTLLDL